LKKHAPQAAIQVLEEAKAQGHKSYRLHKHLADAWLQQDKLEEAAFELEEALRQKPDVPESCYQLGVLLDRIGEHDRAIAVLEHAISLKPKEVGYHQSLGFALESAGRRPEAIRAFKRALELEHTSSSRPAPMRQQG
jgi:tetratricopeptide (TPR) repeat protein